MIKTALIVGTFSMFILMISCGVEKEKVEEQKPIEMTSPIYKRITQMIREEGIEVYNPESGEANFDVFCMQRNTKLLNCFSKLKEKNLDVRLRSFEMDTDTIFFAYIMKE